MSNALDSKLVFIILLLLLLYYFYNHYYYISEITTFTLDVFRHVKCFFINYENPY